MLLNNKVPPLELELGLEYYDVFSARDSFERDSFERVVYNTYTPYSYIGERGERGGGGGQGGVEEGVGGR